ncbi:MAG: hypothetical protein J5821_00145 [Alphaproteobacteria bacterium]|nr:hypothetical protein [Alphaproteobacteria bacterium]
MKKILVVVVAISQCDLQAMWLEEKIKKILPKHSYVLSTTIRETTNEEKAVITEKKESPKNIGAISIATSITAANNEEFSLILSDIKQSPSELTITSSVSANTDTNSINSDYLSMIATQPTYEEKIFTPIENTQSLPKFSSAVPFSDALSDEERIFDIEISGGGLSSPEYILSEEYFPTHYRDKQTHDTQKYGHGTPYKSMKRRKSSLDVYFHGRK